MAHVDALLFDLDGTLIDSMPLHGETWRIMHAEHGMPFDADAFFHGTAGRTNAEILADLMPDIDAARRSEIGALKEARYREMARERLAMIAGFERVHREARARGLKIAICTAAPRDNIAVAQERFALLREVDTVVSPADGLRGKPHPDIFLEAARRLGVDPAHCVVFEDAPLGVQAARNAGMRAVALTTALPSEGFAAYDNLIGAIADFTTFDLATLPARPGTEETRHA